MVSSKMKMAVTVRKREIPVVSLPGFDVEKLKKRKWKVTGFEDEGEEGHSKRKTLVAEAGNLTYRGDNSGSLSLPDRSTRLYVAEVNKTTGQVTMSPAHLFQLQPRTKEDLRRERLQVNAPSFQDKSDLLTKAFGSQKQKRAVASRQRSQMTEGASTTGLDMAMDKARTAQDMPQTVTESQECSTAIPPYNMDAQSPADVYSLRDILGPVQMEGIRNSAEVFKNCTKEMLKEWKEKKKYQSAVLWRLQKLPVEENQRQEWACLLLYLHYMLAMFHFKSDQIRKRDPLPQEWPDVVKHWMLDRFTVKMEGHKRCIPARVKDRLVSHILVLCLILDGFTTPLTHLLQDLKISVSRLHTHVRALGCRVKKEASRTDSPGQVASWSAVLTVPLTFPAPPKPKKKS